MMAMPSVSKNLKKDCEASAFKYNVTARTVFQDKRGHLQIFVSYEDSSSMGKVYLD